MDSDELLSQLKAFAESFAKEQLTPYLKRISQQGAIKQAPKEINDSIWGTIKISPLEVVVIDSPLLQRLRLIRQLGVVHWVYPGATHSRFEHSLGVLHQAQQLINSINHASGEGPAAAPIDGTKASLVRLCAILHDIGHGVFSHVSEHAVARRLDVRLALQSFARQLGIAKIQLSELIAYHLIGSPAFCDMLSVACDRLGNPIPLGGGSKENAERVAHLAQRAIVGHHIDEQVPLLHEIITGPFDADKLDYYQRDARHAGIPSLLDISRLLQKITTRRIASRDVPEDILSALAEARDTRDLFGLKWSGAPMLDELHLARVLLYAKIYRHKKVLAIEAMLDALFFALGSEAGVSAINLVRMCFVLYDDQLLVSSSNDLFRALGIEASSPATMAFVDDVVSRLRNRDLYVSSLALIQKYPSDPWAGDKPQLRGLDRLITDCHNEQSLSKLRKNVAAELQTVAQLVPESVGGIDLSILDHSVVISAKPALGSGTEIDRALVLQGDRFVRGRELDRINQPAWADAYDFGNPQAVVFTPRECAAATYIAFERLLRREYGVVLPTSAIELSKQDPVAIDKLKRKLEGLGWYTGVPIDIRPKPLRLGKQDVVVRVERLGVKFEAIDEPKGTLAPRRAPRMTERILSWLAQFRDDDIIPCALAALENMKILGREDSHATLISFAEAHPEFRGATICPIGDMKDSGVIQAYLSRDLEVIFPRTSTIEEAARRGGEEPIVFLDDFTGSGSQVLDILGNWFGEEELKQSQLGEARLPFRESERTFLRSRPVAFVFLAGWKSGLDRIRQAADKLGLRSLTYAHLTDNQIPFAFDGALADLNADDVQRFQDRCRSIGTSLLTSQGVPADKIAERQLGYGNRGMLLASRLNVPSQTLTCFWLDGQHDGVEWHSLIRRRKKT